MRKRKKYTVSFKQEAVELARRSPNQSQVARDLGIHPSVLQRWKREYSPEIISMRSVNGVKSKEEIKELERENTRLREEVAILKKAVGIFSSNPR